MMSLNKILDEICLVLDVDKGDVYGKSRKREVVEVRVIYSKLAKQNTYFSLEDIGDIINRDHATIIYYVRTHDNLINRDEKYTKKWRECRRIVMPLKDIQKDEVSCLTDKLMHRNAILSERFLFEKERRIKAEKRLRAVKKSINA